MSNIFKRAQRSQWPEIISGKVCITVLTWNGEPWIRACLDSLLKLAYRPLEIIVVDNGSTDGTVGIVKKEYPDIKLVQHPTNSGSAVGFNLCLSAGFQAGGEYTLIVNQDTTAQENMVIELVSAVRANPKAGVFSPIQYNYNGTLLDANFDKFLTLNKIGHAKLKDREIISAKTVIGCAMLIPRTCVEAIGGFDPIYYLYVEEDDFCRRVRHHGFKVGYVPRSRINHNHSLISEKASVNKSVPYLLARNRIIYLLKDPNNTFWFNFKNTFIWRKWSAYFAHTSISEIQKWALLIAFLMLCPVFYFKFLAERAGRCHL